MFCLATNQIAQTGLSSLPPVIYYSEQLFSVVKDKLSGQIDVEGNKIQDLSHFVSEWNDSFEFKFIQPDMLTKSEYSIFNMTHKIASLIGGLPANVKDIKISETMRSELGGFSEACGLWTGSEVIIKRSELVSIERYSATLLHEIAHARSGESDITIGFELELSSLLGMVASKALHGSYDSNKTISNSYSLSLKKKGFWARLFS